MAAVMLAGCTKNNADLETITIGSQMLDYMQTTASSFASSLTEEEKNHFESCKANNDGSLTIQMTPSKQEELLEDYKNSVDESTAKFVASDDYNISAMTFNQDLTKLTITLDDGTEENKEDESAALAFSIYAALYQKIAGVSDDDVNVDIVVYSQDQTLLKEYQYPERAS